MDGEYDDQADSRHASVYRHQQREFGQEDGYQRAHEYQHNAHAQIDASLAPTHLVLEAKKWEELLEQVNIGSLNDVHDEVRWHAERKQTTQSQTRVRRVLEAGCLYIVRYSLLCLVSVMTRQCQPEDDFGRSGNHEREACHDSEVFRRFHASLYFREVRMRQIAEQYDATTDCRASHTCHRQRRELPFSDVRQGIAYQGNENEVHRGDACQTEPRDVAHVAQEGSGKNQHPSQDHALVFCQENSREDSLQEIRNEYQV